MDYATEFDWPELDEVGYRLMRLWRLIALCVLVPVLMLVLIQLAYWPFTGQPPAHFVAFGVLCAIPVSLHAILFPNATMETLAIALGLTFLVLVEPIVSGFGLLRLAELLGFVAIVLFAPSWIERMLQRTRQINARLKSVIQTDAKPEEAREAIPLRPNQQGPVYSTGAMDAQGHFPVMPPQESDPFDRLGGDTVSAPPSKPLFWARTTTNTPQQQQTELFDRDEMGELVRIATVTHDFASSGRLTRIKETEQLPDYPIGMAGVLWATGQGACQLTLHRDALEGRTTMSLIRAHRHSLRSQIATFLPFLDTSFAAQD